MSTRLSSGIPGVMVLAALLGACSDPVGSESTASSAGSATVAEQATPARPPDSSDPAADPASPPGDATDAAGQPLAWEDTPEGWLAWWAQSRGIEDPPVVEVVRETRPEEAGELIAACVQEQGFDAQAFPDGSWETVGAPGQAEAVALAEYRCIAAYPLQPVFYQPLDDELLRQSYDWHVTTTIPCLQQLGHATPQPPTLEVYIETYRARGEQWIAQHEGGLPFETWEQCPPVPPWDVLVPPGS